MTEPLTALDATFLELEQADESARMHIGAVLVFPARPDGSVPTLAEVRNRLTMRLDALPRYRQRLSEPDVGRLGWPAWEPDPAFSLDHHVRRAALPEPGFQTELLEWAGEVYSHRLDRTRPLWEVVLLEGLADGRWALVTKTHHCMVDGVGSIDVGMVLLDFEPDASDAPVAASWRPPERRSPGGLALLRVPPGVVRAGAKRWPIPTTSCAARSRSPSSSYATSWSRRRIAA